MRAEYARATESSITAWNGVGGYFIDSTQAADAVSERTSVGVYIFHSNAACRRFNWRLNSVDELVERAVHENDYETTPRQYTGWNGYYFIEGDTLKAWLPITFFGSRINLKETVFIRFEGYVRDSITITSWRMTEPKGKPSSMKFNNQEYQSLVDMNTTLHFQPHTEVRGMNNSLEWVSRQINRSEFSFFD